MADKLDGVMLVVFNYLDQRLTANASLPPETILETPVAGEGVCEAAAAAQAVLRGDEAGSDSGTLKGPGGMLMQQGMEPVARLLKVGSIVSSTGGRHSQQFPSRNIFGTGLLSFSFGAQDDEGAKRRYEG